MKRGGKRKKTIFKKLAETINAVKRKRKRIETSIFIVFECCEQTSGKFFFAVLFVQFRRVYCMNFLFHLFFSRLQGQCGREKSTSFLCVDPKSNYCIFSIT